MQNFKISLECEQTLYWSLERDLFRAREDWEIVGEIYLARKRARSQQTKFARRLSEVIQEVLFS